MSYKTVKTQTELDAALAAGVDRIIIKSPAGVWLRIDGSASVEAFDSASVRASGSASVEAFDSASVEASGSASVRAFDSASVEAFDSASVEAFDSASVEASGSASVRAFDSASVEAFDSASVRAFDSASVRASGSASVEASGSASVEASDSASVRASDSASVRASDSASVRASGSASVRASKFVAIHLWSSRVTLHGGVLIDLTNLDQEDTDDWIAYTGATVEDGLVHLFKAVGDDLYAGHSWVKTQYPVGEDVLPDRWVDNHDCGHGLHACPTVGDALDHFSDATRFLEVTAPVESIRCIDWSKCKAPKLHVLREVDRHGQPLEAQS